MVVEDAWACGEAWRSHIALWAIVFGADSAEAQERLPHVVGHEFAIHRRTNIIHDFGVQLLVAVGAPNDERHLVLVAEHIGRGRIRHMAAALVAIVVDFLTMVAEIHHHGILIAVEVEDVPHHGIVI